MQQTHLNPDRRFLLEHIKFDKSISRAQGNYLYDTHGNKYLDCLAQYGAMPFGHNPKFLWDRLIKIQKNSEPSLVQPLLSTAAETLATRLVELAPGDMHYVTFTNSGAESVEAAIKLARAKTKKQTILATFTGFHGKTLGAVSATGNPMYSEPFNPDTSSFEHVAFNDLSSLQKRLEQGGVAAFIVEPVQGEGGMIVADPDYLGRASKLCKQYGALFIVDEIQTGIGRTGKLFACEHEKELHIDILLLAKALGGGLVSLGAMLCRKNTWVPEFGYYHSSTFANNHISCSIGLECVEKVLEKDNKILKNVEQMGNYLEIGLQTITSKYPKAFSAHSGKGLMRGIQLAAWDGEQSYLMALAGNSGQAVPLVCGYLLNKHNILTAPVFNNSRVLRIQPPLLVNKTEIDELIAALEKTAQIITRQNYYELFTYIVGEPDKSRTTFINRLDFSRIIEKHENIETKGKAQGKFVFLIHPTEIDDLVSCQPPAFEFFNNEQENNWREWLQSWCARRYDPGVVYHMPRFVSATGEFVEGWLIACPLTPKQMMRLPIKERKKLIQSYIDIAKELCVDMLGLGAFTSVITRAGTDIEDCGINITTGNSLTAMASAESLMLAANKRGLNLRQQTAGIVGAAGSVGRLVCKRLLSEVGGLVLFGNPENPKSIEKLEELAGNLYLSIIKNEDKTPGNGIAKKLYAVKPKKYWLELYAELGNDKGNKDFQLFHAINAAFKNINACSPITATTDLETHLPRVNLVVSATSHGASFIDAKLLADNSIVCDAARPPDVRKDVSGNDRGVLVYEGGLLYLPTKTRFGKDNVLGFPDGINLACLSETIALSFVKSNRNFSIGLEVPLEEARYIYDLAIKHGFGIALLDSYGEVEFKEIALETALNV